MSGLCFDYILRGAEVKKEKVNDYNDFPLYVFHQGKNFKAQDFLGAHKVEDGKYVFRVWAPNAESIFVTGTFTFCLNEKLIVAFSL